MQRELIVPVGTLLMLLACGGCSHKDEADSVGRGWPMADTPVRYVSGGMEGAGKQASWDGPPGDVAPLPVDLFTTQRFLPGRGALV